MACVTGCFIFIWKVVYPHSYHWINLSETIIYFIYIVSHSLTMLVNQGVPSQKYLDMVNALVENDKLNGIKDNSHYRKCNKCNINVLIKDNVVHCDDCGLCIIEYDHHCPWTSKCIGKYNFYIFHTFCVSIFILIFLTFSTVLICLLNTITKQ